MRLVERLDELDEFSERATKDLIYFVLNDIFAALWPSKGCCD